MDFVILVMAGSATATVTLDEEEPIVDPFIERETLLL